MISVDGTRSEPAVRATLVPFVPFVLLAVAATVVIGCGGTIPESRYYVLDYIVDEQAETLPLEMMLGVDVFAARPIFRDRRIAYRVSDYEMAYYPYRFWAADPGELIATQLADQLRRRRVATAVLEQPFELVPDWVISGRLQRFEELDRGDQWYAVCEVAVRIEDAIERRVLTEKVLRQEIRTQSRTPEAVAAAMSLAVREIGAAVEAMLRETAGREARQ